MDFKYLDSDKVHLLAKALGDGTRYKLFRYIAQAGQPVFIDELTQFAKVNHNAVRQHLEVLKYSGLVIEEIEPRRQPGRPRLRYIISPSASGLWNTEGPYRRAAKLLTKMVKTGHSARDVGRSDGESRAQRVIEEAPQLDLIQILQYDLSHQGFDPEYRHGESERHFILNTCPFEEVASVDPKTICQIHLGILEGMVSKIDSTAKVSLKPSDPHKAQCCVKIRSA